MTTRRETVVGAVMLSILLLLVLAGGALGDHEQPAPTAKAATAATSPLAATATPPTPAATGSTPSKSAASTPIPMGAAKVVWIVDGDTFKTSDGETVRVLGIDSCEIGTRGGELAAQSANSILSFSNGDVTLSAEPGVDRDRYGRLPRYVTMRNGSDFGEAMVQHGHTQVYRGRNDASAAYVEGLRAKDFGVWDCGQPGYDPESDPRNYVYVPTPDVDRRLYAPTPRVHRDGGSRGGFCSRRRWC